MKKIIFALSITSILSFKVNNDVYICGKQGAKKYHLSENCRGLGSCKHEVYKTSLTKAKSFGLELCGWED